MVRYALVDYHSAMRHPYLLLKDADGLTHIFIESLEGRRLLFVPLCRSEELRGMPGQGWCRPAFDVSR
jgi:hypothetical protein